MIVVVVVVVVVTVVGSDAACSRQVLARAIFREGCKARTGYGATACWPGGVWFLVDV